MKFKELKTYNDIETVVGILKAHARGAKYVTIRLEQLINEGLAEESYATNDQQDAESLSIGVVKLLEEIERLVDVVKGSTSDVLCKIAIKGVNKDEDSDTAM